MTLVIDRKAYAEKIGEPEELLDPLPQIAPAYDGVTQRPFVLGLPQGDGTYVATFYPGSAYMTNCAAVRYGAHPPIYLSYTFFCALCVHSCDALSISYKP